MHPVFLQIGSFYIGTYGVALAAALLLGTMIALGRAKRVGVAGETVMDLVFFAVIAGIVGGRVAYILVNFDDFQERPFALIFSRTGFVFLGSVIASLIAITYIVVRRKLNFWMLTDVLIPAVPIGHFFGRIGCFLVGCCHGRLVDPDGPLGFLAVRFPRPTAMGEGEVGGLAFYAHQQLHMDLTQAGFTEAGLADPATVERACAQGLEPLAAAFDPMASHSLPVWPVQLFESFGNLLIFAAVLFIWGRRRFNGQVFLVYLGLYSVMRFSLEFLRGDTERGTIGPLSTSQALTLLGLAFAVGAWFWLRRAQDLERLAAVAEEESPSPPPDKESRKPRRLGNRKKRKHR